MWSQVSHLQSQALFLLGAVLPFHACHGWRNWDLSCSYAFLEFSELYEMTLGISGIAMCAPPTTPSRALFPSGVIGVITPQIRDQLTYLGQFLKVG